MVDFHYLQKSMRTAFQEYLTPDKKTFNKLWKEAVFVFDSSVLLNLYEMPLDAKEKMLLILENLSEKKRLWVPHQVAQEYYRNRYKVIYKQESAHKDLLEQLNKLKEEVCKKFDDTKLFAPLEKDFKSISKQMENTKKKFSDYLNSDSIEKHLNKVFSGTVGSAYSADKVSELVKEGELRYGKELPPGYKDINKDRGDKTGLEKFGDLVIWYQIIDMAHSESKHVIFVTDDDKEDWWWKVQDHTVGPRFELLKEFNEKTSKQAYIYQTESFMKHAGEYLKVKFDKTLIERVKKNKQVSRFESELVRDPNSGGILERLYNLTDPNIPSNHLFTSWQETTDLDDKNNEDEGSLTQQSTL